MDSAFVLTVCWGGAARRLAVAAAGKIRVICDGTVLLDAVPYLLGEQIPVASQMPVDLDRYYGVGAFLGLLMERFQKISGAFLLRVRGNGQLFAEGPIDRQVRLSPSKTRVWPGWSKPDPAMVRGQGQSADG